MTETSGLIRTLVRHELKRKEETLKEALEKIQQEKDETVNEFKKAQDRIKEVEGGRNELQMKVFALTQEKARLATEKKDAEEVCGEFKDEAEKTMMDYNELADDYKQACKDRDENRMRRDNALKTIDRRNRELEEKKKLIDELEKQKVELDKQKMELENELAAMREQV